MDLRLGAIDTTNVNKNRKGKERDNQKSSKTVHNSKNMWKDVQMHGKMHEHVTCKVNTSWAQPNLILLAHKENARI